MGHMDSHHFCQFLIKHLYHEKKKWRTIKGKFNVHFKFLFIYFWLCWIFVALSGSIEWRLLSNCGAWASHCSGFSCCRAQAPGHTGFSSCGTWAQSLRLWGSRTTGSTVSLYFTGLVAPWHVGSSWTWDQTPCLLH